MILAKFLFHCFPILWVTALAFHLLVNWQNSSFHYRIGIGNLLQCNTKKMLFRTHFWISTNQLPFCSHKMRWYRVLRLLRLIVVTPAGQAFLIYRPQLRTTHSLRLKHRSKTKLFFRLAEFRSCAALGMVINIHCNNRKKYIICAFMQLAIKISTLADSMTSCHLFKMTSEFSLNSLSFEVSIYTNVFKYWICFCLNILNFKLNILIAD